MSVEWQYYRGILINDNANVNDIFILHISWYNSFFFGCEGFNMTNDKLIFVNSL